MATTQKRYRDWLSPVMSKDSVEDVAILSGIGPKFGFDACKWDNTTNTLELGSDLTGANGAVQQVRQITTRSGVLQTPQYGVVTPDGIITIFYAQGVQPLDRFTLSLGTTREVMVIAKHIYVESSSVESITTFEVIVNRTESSWLTQVKDKYSNMQSFLNIASTSAVDFTNSVVIGIFKMPTTSDTITPENFAIPINYAWKGGQSPGGTGGGIVTPTVYPKILVDEDLADHAVEGDTRTENFRIFNAFPGGMNGHIYNIDTMQFVRSLGWPWATGNNRPVKGRGVIVSLGNNLYQTYGWFYTRAYCEIQSSDFNITGRYASVSIDAGVIVSTDSPWAVEEEIPSGTEVQIISDTLEIKQKCEGYNVYPPTDYNVFNPGYPIVFPLSQGTFRVSNGADAPYPVIPHGDTSYLSAPTYNQLDRVNCRFGAERGYPLNAITLSSFLLDLVFKWDVTFRVLR